MKSGCWIRSIAEPALLTSASARQLICTGICSPTFSVCSSRYTRSVGLNQRTISIVVLAVLTALPVSRTLCAMLCDSAAKATAAAHHGSGTNCEEPPRPSTGTQIQGVSEHDCSTHDAAVRQATSTVAERADGVPGSLLLATPTSRAIATGLIRVDSSFDYDAPPGTAPPTTIPLVLRV